MKKRNKYDVFNGEDEKPAYQKKKQGFTPSTNLDFGFEDQEDEIELFDIDMDLKTRKQLKHINIITQQKKHTDASTKLF
jgi:hypothetical protein